MPTKTASIPDTLDRHLSANSSEDLPGITTYVDTGASLVSTEAILSLQRLLNPLHKKIHALKDSVHLRNRLGLLATYFEEACADGNRGTPAHREAAFALLYFLKGFDRIPDSIPEVGLLDDAMIVQVVLQRHESTLKQHWLRRHRPWPAWA